MSDCAFPVPPVRPRAVAAPVPVAVRPGTAADLPFVDALQKRHADAVGWMPMQSLEGKVRAGHVLVAEEQ